MIGEIAPALELEMSALGSCFYGNDTLSAARSALKPEHFMREAHKIIFRTMIEIQDAGGVVDLVTVHAKLGREALANCGGEGYLIQLMDYVPSPENVDYYCRLVHERWQRWQYSDFAKRLLRLASDPDSPIEALRAQATSIAESVSSGHVPIVNLADVNIDEPDTGAPTAFPMLNHAISTGGWPDGQMSIIRAYHKGGKSTFMVSDFVAACEAGERCLYATFADLSAKQLKRRMVRNLSGRSRRPEFDQIALEDYESAIYRIAIGWDGFVYDASKLDTGSDVETFLAWLKADHARKPWRRVYVDYAQELSSCDRRATDDVREQGVCASKLARAAANTGLPIIVGSQITEGVNGARTKTKGSRAWEEKAGWVLTLDREGEVDATVEITFSRFGPQAKVIPFVWNDKHLRFEQRPQAA